MFPKFLPALFLRLKVLSLDGSVLLSREEVGHSWVRGAYNFFFASLAGNGGGGTNTFGAGYMSSKNIAGIVLYTTGSNIDRGNIAVPGSTGLNPSTAVSTFGMCVGTDDTAFSIEDYKLGAKIAHGTGSGQLSYGITAAPVLDYTSKVWKATHVRTFSNLSAGEITVKEVGLEWMGGFFGTSASHLFSRDVLAESITIASLAVLQVSYDLSYDFSAID
jgi:hypothetical protein